MRALKRFGFLVRCILAFTMLACTSLAEGQLFWTEFPADGKIARANLDGSGKTDIVTGIQQLGVDIAVDPIAGKIYWSDYGSHIARANLNGTQTEVFLPIPELSIFAIDPLYRRQLYYVDNSNPTEAAVRAHLDTGAAGGFVAGASNLGYAAIHAPSRFLYYSDSSGFAKVRRTKINGSLNELFFDDSVDKRKMAIDPLRDKLFIIYSPNAIKCFAIPSTTPCGVIAVNATISGIAIDVPTGRVYWSEVDTGQIRRAEGDFSGVQTVLSGLTLPSALALISSSDCNSNGIDDWCDVSCGPVGGPCNVPGCGTQQDCDGNQLLDSCEGAGAFPDCNDNSVSDQCDVEAAGDCNQNGIPDDCDLASSDDCNSNAIPDDCDLLVVGDCNENGSLDHCDVTSGASDDCNANFTPDECELAATGDCNGNNSLDSCDLSSGSSADCNSNGNPDECDPGDCDMDGIPEECEYATDCNNNSVADNCDIAQGSLTDADGDGIADECCPPPCAPGTVLAESPSYGKNRFISFQVPITGTNESAIRVELAVLHDTSSPPDAPNFSSFEGQFRYLNAILDGDGNSVFDCPDSSSSGTTYKCAAIGCNPEYRDWVAAFEGQLVHVTGDSVVPSSTYRVYHVAASCAGQEASCLVVSSPLTVTTPKWGDVDGDGLLNASDISRVVDKVKDLPTALLRARTLLQPAVVETQQTGVNAQTLGRSVDAVKGKAYPFTISQCP